MQPYIRGGILEFFPRTVEALGGEASSLLKEADVAPEVLSIPGTFLPYASYMRLMDSAARRLDAPHFGLAMARHGNAETLGTIGLIMQQAQSIGAAWDTMGQFYRIHDTYGSVKLRRAGGYAVVSYGIPRNDQPGARQIYDVAGGMVCNIMRQFCGPDFRALEIGFPYQKPSDLTQYRHLPSDKLRFGTTALELYLESVLLDQPLPGGKSDELKLVLDDYFSTHAGPVSTAQRVEDMIRRLLPTGVCTLPRVAETLSMSVRTLQAKLDEEQNSFRQILENVRREIAVYHLRRGDMQMTQLAMVLGYSELSAFSRSFRNWYGVSPRRWLEQGDWRP